MSVNNYSFIEEDKIQAPVVLNTHSDFEQLFLHVISHFYEEIDSFSSKKQLLVSLKSIIFEYIPAVYPQYYSNYPDTLPNIYALISETIIINQERHDSLPDIYAIMKTTETA